eukprot:TRINITY_DN12716_c0_g1_i1.p1 TRINITY_DN12716_c0_g1~~TRINITY_DN12716_c0_g1_i1.p1  ORF type:complete len:228 (-),score=57.54 TRINITY_DN12716_c0_g1_i1:169-852(-)
MGSNSSLSFLFIIASLILLLSPSFVFSQTDSGIWKIVRDTHEKQKVYKSYFEKGDCEGMARFGVPARMDVEDPKGLTSLHAASGIGCVYMLRPLIQCGADVNKVSDYGTPLHVASSFNQKECAHSLISFGADVNKMEKEGRSAVHSAAIAGHFEMVSNLIAAGAGINSKDKQGKNSPPPRRRVRPGQGRRAPGGQWRADQPTGLHRQDAASSGGQEWAWDDGSPTSP